MKVGCTVILESTVYPGVTEDVVKPILEESGLKCGKDFKIAYSPERINPGDNEHTIDKVIFLLVPIYIAPLFILSNTSPIHSSSFQAGITIRVLGSLLVSILYAVKYIGQALLPNQP